MSPNTRRRARSKAPRTIGSLTCQVVECSQGIRLSILRQTTYTKIFAASHRPKPGSEIASPGLRPRSPETVVPAAAALIDKAARTVKVDALPRDGAEAAASGVAATSNDGPTTEQSKSKMIEIVRYFNLCILFGLLPKTPNQTRGGKAMSPLKYGVTSLLTEPMIIGSVIKITSHIA